MLSKLIKKFGVGMPIRDEGEPEWILLRLTQQVILRKGAQLRAPQIDQRKPLVVTANSAGDKTL
ncbi:MAG: hypothetical protein AAFY83_13465, partial [Pseudomonadota bacterium]